MLDFFVTTMRFELEHLESYDDEALLAELRRVAPLIETPKITVGEFTARAKIHGSTLQKRFGGWRGALEAAGLGDRFDDTSLRKSREEILTAIKATASKLQKDVLTRQEFQAHTGMADGPARRVFGSWKAALAAAGLGQSALAKRYTDEECFENMLSVWTHYGRQPRHHEMNRGPSVVGSKAYVGRWGTWRKALAAFVQRVSSEPPAPGQEPREQPEQPQEEPFEPKRGPRDIPLALRYYVLRRDNFRCVACGASPAISTGVVLHVDHIHPWARGGATVADNLRTLCEACNLGKGVSSA
ncbi:MAG: homing endonuclease associated repeat-containing protein [Candidatus Binatia bacterium]